VPKSGIGAELPELTIVTKTTSKTMEKIKICKTSTTTREGLASATLYGLRRSRFDRATLPDSFSEVPLGDSEMAAGAFWLASAPERVAGSANSESMTR